MIFYVQWVYFRNITLLLFALRTWPLTGWKMGHNDNIKTDAYRTMPLKRVSLLTMRDVPSKQLYKFGFLFFHISSRFFHILLCFILLQTLGFQSFQFLSFNFATIFQASSFNSFSSADFHCFYTFPVFTFLRVFSF